MRTISFAITCIALLTLVVFCGCAKQPGEYGNFAKIESVELVQDAISALTANYPPAKTRIALVRDTPDAFGSALVEAMRANGYAVAEYAPPAKSDKYLSAVKKPDSLAFAYVLDGTGDELRVSLHIGGETLSRMYRVQRSGEALQFIPQGLWTRRQ